MVGPERAGWRPQPRGGGETHEDRVHRGRRRAEDDRGDHGMCRDVHMVCRLHEAPTQRPRPQVSEGVGKRRTNQSRSESLKPCVRALQGGLVVPVHSPPSSPDPFVCLPWALQTPRPRPEHPALGLCRAPPLLPVRVHAVGQALTEEGHGGLMVTARARMLQRPLAHLVPLHTGAMGT